MSHFVRQTRVEPSWLPYLIVGVVICLFLESVFYSELGNKRLMFFFIWAYSQAALLELLVPNAGPPSWVFQRIVWLLFYILLAFCLWAFLGRSQAPSRTLAWRRAIAGWVVAEILLAIVSAGALYTGFIQME